MNATPVRNPQELPLAVKAVLAVMYGWQHKPYMPKGHYDAEGTDDERDRRVWNQRSTWREGVPQLLITVVLQAVRDASNEPVYMRLEEAIGDIEGHGYIEKCRAGYATQDDRTIQYVLPNGFTFQTEPVPDDAPPAKPGPGIYLGDKFFCWHGDAASPGDDETLVADYWPRPPLRLDFKADGFDRHGWLADDAGVWQRSAFCPTCGAGTVLRLTKVSPVHWYDRDYQIICDACQIDVTDADFAMLAYNFTDAGLKVAEALCNGSPPFDPFARDARCIEVPPPAKPATAEDFEGATPDAPRPTEDRIAGGTTVRTEDGTHSIRVDEPSLCIYADNKKIQLTSVLFLAFNEMWERRPSAVRLTKAGGEAKEHVRRLREKLHESGAPWLAHAIQAGRRGDATYFIGLQPPAPPT